MAKALAAEMANFIREHYATHSNQWIAERTGKTARQIGAWANTKRLIKSDLWSEEHIALLRREYEYGDLDLVVQKTGKRKKTIREYARRLGLVRRIQGNRKGTLAPLLSETLQSFYWLGFYAADGYISKGGHFQCGQRTKDKDRIDALAAFLKTGVYEIERAGIGGFKPGRYFRVNVQDRVLGLQIRNLFKITNKKTYDGIELEFMKTGDIRNVAFLVGFIDGDGNRLIRRTGIQATCHLAWKRVFHELIKKLPEQLHNQFTISEHTRKSDGRTYARLYIKARGTRMIVRWLVRSGLDCSKRKWPEAHKEFPATASA